NPDEVNAKSLVMLLEYLEKLPEAVRNHKTRSSAQEKEATFHLRCAQELSNWLVENSMPENLIYTIRDFANLNGRSSRTYLISKRNDLDAINAYIDQLAKFALHLKKQANEADSLLLLTSDVQKRLDALMELFKKL
ncbi:MAG: hypothetical protein CMJ93_02485, partial [Planctomycetes bacterium]|nr:hypothetical protein [Planctomycetota bacterium]